MDKPGLHIERLERVARIIQSVRDVNLTANPRIGEARGGCTTALTELTKIIQEMKDQIRTAA